MTNDTRSLHQFLRMEPGSRRSRLLFWLRWNVEGRP